MSRVTKLLKSLQKELKGESQKALASPDSLDVSSIEKASFFQGDQYSSHGNPLHSTALEDESTPQSDHRQKNPTDPVNEARGVTETPKRVETNRNNAQQKRDVQARDSTKSKEKRRQAQQTDKGQKSRSVIIQRRLQVITESREDEGNRRKSKGPVREVASNDLAPESAAHSQRRPSLSSEELTDEDESFHPSSAKRKQSYVRLQKPRASSSQQQRRRKQKRVSSSGSSDDSYPAKKSKPGSVRSLIDLDVVLNAFLEFVTEYKETVNSESVKKSIDAFSKSFEEQLAEKITATKELNSVKREAVKVNCILNHKKRRLLEVKNELIKSEAEMRILQQEHSNLEQRLKALTQGTTFLTNLKDLNRKYLQHRTAHPDQPETYGVSCIPAMLLESRSITGLGNQFITINHKLQQVLEDNGLE